mmetsp:Transcript_1744/g.7786  ORF Transcript_1744/g.7786 Transcript_1744/m.7786 type:complete len:357 (+) Transcript_1744:2284-3354(+)
MELVHNCLFHHSPKRLRAREVTCVRRLCSRTPLSIAGSLMTGSHHLLRVRSLPKHLHLLPLNRRQHRHLLRCHAHHLLQQHLLLVRNAPHLLLRRRQGRHAATHRRSRGRTRSHHAVPLLGWRGRRRSSVAGSSAGVAAHRPRRSRQRRPSSRAVLNRPRRLGHTQRELCLEHRERELGVLHQQLPGSRLVLPDELLELVHHREQLRRGHLREPVRDLVHAAPLAHPRGGHLRPGRCGVRPADGRVVANRRPAASPRAARLLGERLAIRGVREIHPQVPPVVLPAVQVPLGALRGRHVHVLGEAVALELTGVTIGDQPEVVHGPDLAEHVSQTLLRGIVRDVADEDLERGSAHLAT